MTENKGLAGDGQQENVGEDCAFGADRPARVRAVKLLQQGMRPRVTLEIGTALELVDALVAAVRESLPPLACRRVVLRKGSWESRCLREDGHGGECADNSRWTRAERP